MQRYKNSQKLFSAFLQGAELLQDNVVSTFGPQGRNVIIADEELIITKDGVTVAKHVEADDDFENMAVHVLRQAAHETNKMAGDGTTTSIILATAILQEAAKYLLTHHSLRDLQREMNEALQFADDKLKEYTEHITAEEQLLHIATMAANGDKSIGKLITDALKKAGKGGTVTIDQARSMETKLKVEDGFRIPSGLLSKSFCTDPVKEILRYENPLILVTDYTINSSEMLAYVDAYNRTSGVLEQVAAVSTHPPLLIFAEDVSGTALAMLIMNTVRGTMRCAAIKPPSYGEHRQEILTDLAMATGAKYISATKGHILEDVKLADLGRARRVEATAFSTTILGGDGDWKQIDEKVAALKEQIAASDDLELCKRLQDRVLRLSSGIVIIQVGGHTETEAVEKKFRIEDALQAVLAAQDSGILPGGGVALLQIAQELLTTFDTFGARVLASALKVPFQALCASVEKAGLESNVNLQYGYDFSLMEPALVELKPAGIIDSYKVVACALRNAFSAATALLSANYSIVKT